MKNLKTLLFALSFISVLACSSSDDTIETVADIKCGFYNGNQLWKGPQGGCYYYNDNDNKTYVDRDECNC